MLFYTGLRGLFFPWLSRYLFCMSNDVCILATGGTIDKDHDPVSEQLVFSAHSHIPEMLVQFRAIDIPHDIVMLKDSLEVSLQDRALLKDAILARAEKSVVVTHGTSTMTETAAYLVGKVPGKTVVLTGAMRPFNLFRSDAGFNLGSAISAARLLDPGVYITMNGQIFNPGDVRKDVEKGIFVRK